MGGARQEGGALHGAGVEPAVRGGEEAYRGRGPEAGGAFPARCALAGRGRGGRAEPGVPPVGRTKSPRKPPLGPNWCGCAGNFRARPCVFPSIWRRPAESGAGESIFGSGGDTRLG